MDLPWYTQFRRSRAHTLTKSLKNTISSIYTIWAPKFGPPEHISSCFESQREKKNEQLIIRLSRWTKQNPSLSWSALHQRKTPQTLCNISKFRSSGPLLVDRSGVRAFNLWMKFRWSIQRAEAAAADLFVMNINHETCPKLLRWQGERVEDSPLSFVERKLATNTKPCSHYAAHQHHVRRLFFRFREV